MKHAEKFYINEYGYKCWKPEFEPAWIKTRRENYREQWERMKKYGDEVDNGAGCYDTFYDGDQA